MRALWLVPLVLLLSCSRPLTTGEAAFVADLQGETLNPKPIRMTRDVPLGVATFQLQKRPRLTCRARLYPEPEEKVVTVSPAALVLFNQMLFSEGWYSKDYMKNYPQKMNLQQAMLFAHEVTHVWQWQNRALTGYSPIKAAREHGGGKDPYLFEVTTNTPFLEYGYEQQASIVEEYVCCTMLDPDAPRTKRMETLLQEVFPLQSLPRPEEILLPWNGVELKGICR